MRVVNGRAILELGDVITIRHGQTLNVLTTGNISHLSPTGVRVEVTRADGNKRTFYHQKGTLHYVENPGSGIAGRLLNDFFRADEAKSP